MNSSTVLKQNPEMITRTIDGHAVIMDPQEGKVLTLNEVGTLVWELAEGSSTKGEILDAICQTFEVGREEALSDMEEFTAALIERHLLFSED